MTIHTPTITPATSIRPSNDELRDALERQTAAKLCAMLPADDQATRRILAHAAIFHQQFTSIAAVRAASAEG